MPEPMTSVALIALHFDDADTIAAWGDDPDFRRAAGWSNESRRDDRSSRLRHLIETPPPDLLRLGVEHDGVLVGYVDLRGTDGHERELGYVIGDRLRWGQGLGFAAASAACTFAFEDLGLTVLTAEVAAENMRSIAILNRLGMRELGAAETSGHRRLVLHRHDA